MVQNEFKNKRILITGGLGFIGSNLASRLVERGAEVTLIDSLTPEYGGNLFNIEPFRDRIRVNISDVRDVHSLRYLVQEQDFLFNLAGQTSHVDSMNDPNTDLEINCRAQLSILEACRKNNPALRIVFASTRQLYGKPQYLPVDEKHPVQPVDVNGINKLAGENYHMLYCQVYGIPTCVLRFTNTIGPRMRVKDARQTFLGIWIRNLLEGKPIEVWGGTQLRDILYVDDAIDALLLAGSSPNAIGKIFNVGRPDSISLLDLARALVDANGGGEMIVNEYPADRKKIDIGDYSTDPTLIQQSLGWSAKVPLEQALSRTIDFYREHLSHYV
ncbi:NAD-dependent epimerase/dehydratase family protein [Novipirellula sp.]|uniref:NAD-dependent epimerase/dehydratase family protein n=1 Tax=Novipirellula sp. TaxID=2795430 RepID=UPI003561EF07